MRALIAAFLLLLSLTARAELTIIQFDITTTAGGAELLASPLVEGCLLHARYVANTMDTGADLDVTGVITGVVLVNIDNAGTSDITRVIRTATHDETGAASLYAAAGEPVEALICVKEELKLVVAQGGATKLGTLYLTFTDTLHP